MLSAAFAVMVGVGWAQDDPARAALAHAVRQYLDGNSASARTELQNILTEGPSLPAEVRQEALLWLGDILYAEAGASAARNVFETLLSQSPDYPIDPFAHSAEVVSYFEQVRETLKARTPKKPEVRAPATPWPWKTLIPGGIGWFVDGKPLAGSVVGGLQLAGLGLSIGTYVQLTSSYPGDWPAPGAQFPQEQADELERWKTSHTLNQAAVAGAALAYLLPIVVETGVWAGRRRVAVMVGPNTVTFAGNF